MRLSLLALLCLCLALPAHAKDPAPPLRIVASFSILGDMVRQIGGQAVQVDDLIGPGQDAHEFQPSPQDARKLAEADIIAINGLKFEGWMGRLIKASGTKAKLLVASAGVQPLILEENRQTGESLVDPHAWQDPSNGRIYAQNIARALIEARPAQKDVFLTRARALVADIAALDAKARAAFAAIPEEKRKLVTSHDAFAYLGRAYGLTLLAPLGAEPAAEPSAAVVAKLIETIRAEKVKAIFLEGTGSPRLLEQIARETDATIGGTLYADTLTDRKGPAPSYGALLRHNVAEILRALGK